MDPDFEMSPPSSSSFSSSDELEDPVSTKNKKKKKKKRARHPRRRHRPQGDRRGRKRRRESVKPPTPQTRALARRWLGDAIANISASGMDQLVTRFQRGEWEHGFAHGMTRAQSLDLLKSYRRMVKNAESAKRCRVRNRERVHQLEAEVEFLRKRCGLLPQAQNPPQPALSSLPPPLPRIKVKEEVVVCVGGAPGSNYMDEQGTESDTIGPSNGTGADPLVDSSTTTPEPSLVRATVVEAAMEEIRAHFEAVHMRLFEVEQAYRSSQSRAQDLERQIEHTQRWIWATGATRGPPCLPPPLPPRLMQCPPGELHPYPLHIDPQDLPALPYRPHDMLEAPVVVVNAALPAAGR